MEKSSLAYFRFPHEKEGKIKASWRFPSIAPWGGNGDSEKGSVGEIREVVAATVVVKMGGGDACSPAFPRVLPKNLLDGTIQLMSYAFQWLLHSGVPASWRISRFRAVFLPNAPSSSRFKRADNVKNVHH